MIAIDTYTGRDVRKKYPSLILFIENKNKQRLAISIFISENCFSALPGALLAEVFRSFREVFQNMYNLIISFIGT